MREMHGYHAEHRRHAHDAHDAHAPADTPATRALELLSPLIDADARPDQQVRQLPAFVGIGDSGPDDISERVDDLLAGGFGE